MSTEPTLAQSAELVRAAKTVAEQLRMIKIAKRHGHSANAIRAHLYPVSQYPANKTAAKAEGEVT
jgi:hypothetical protein